MRLYVDSDRCEGHQLCHASDATLFPLTADGYSAVEGGREVPPELHGRAEEGVGACPLMALRLEG
jgi:ferredoxin